MDRAWALGVCRRGGLRGVACLLLLPIAGCHGGTTHVRSATPTPKPSPYATPPTDDRLTAALLPKGMFHGYHRYGPSPGTVTDLLAPRLANAIGLPNVSGACATMARTLVIDPDKAGAATLDRPYSEVTYVRGSSVTADVTYETVTSLPADVPADATRITVPSGCRNYTTRQRGVRIAVTVRPLTGTGLPRVDGAQVSGLESTMTFAGQGRLRIRTLNIRSGPVLILLSVGGGKNVPAATAKTATAAAARAHEHLA